MEDGADGQTIIEEMQHRSDQTGEPLALPLHFFLFLNICDGQN